MTIKTPDDYKSAIAQSGKTIYEVNEVGHPEYWVPSDALEKLLSRQLVGLSLAGYALRTRSKVVKAAVCEALGYPVPKSFKKTQPRFLGQQLDVYTQKSDNLQIWNEELSPARRYALIAISNDDIVTQVRVANGQELSLLDTTGKITTKYQARITPGSDPLELVSNCDTDSLAASMTASTGQSSTSPTEPPTAESLLPISTIFERLKGLIGTEFPDPGVDQERNRGAELHRLVCNCLGYRIYGDLGTFPDVMNQLLEVKLQTSPTIDLGLVLPSSEERLDIAPIGSFHPRHCDTRYAVFYARTDGTLVTITHLILSTGRDFFHRFTQFGGRELNGKIQIPLPSGFLRR